MIQMKPYEFMVKYTQQKDWIDGRGNFIAFAFFLGGISGGLYLAASYFDSLLGQFVAWLLALCMGVSYMVHLSKPLRFWRMFMKPGTSWIARGFIFIMLFIGLTFIQLILSQWVPSATAAITTFTILAAIFAFAQSIYTGFAVSYVSAIKIWNSAIVPILFVVAGVAGGLGILMLASQGESAARVLDIARGCFYVLAGYAVFTAIYLWVSTYENTNARDSVTRILTGEVSRVFWLVVVVVGMVLPLGLIAPYAFNAVVSPAAFIIAGACILVGGIGLRYVILKAGVYSPLVPSE